MKRLNIFNSSRDLNTFVRQYLADLYAEDDYTVTCERWNACYMVELTPGAITKLTK